MVGTKGTWREECSILQVLPFSRMFGDSSVIVRPWVFDILRDVDVPFAYIQDVSLRDSYFICPISKSVMITRILIFLGIVGVL